MLSDETVAAMREFYTLNPRALFSAEILLLLSSPRVEEVRREALEEAAKVVESPYSDDVIALGTDEPFAVGRKIAEAIRALSPPVG